MCSWVFGVSNTVIFPVAVTQNLRKLISAPSVNVKAQFALDEGPGCPIRGLTAFLASALAPGFKLWPKPEQLRASIMSKEIALFIKSPESYKFSVICGCATAVWKSKERIWEICSGLACRALVTRKARPLVSSNAGCSPEFCARGGTIGLRLYINR